MEPELLSEGGNCVIGMRKSALDKHGLNTALQLGKVSEEGALPLQVYMDSLYPHVVFICGTRGSGKSYTLGILAEELVEKNPNVGIVIIDPIGVFWSMKSANKEDREVELLKQWQLEPKNYPVKVMIPEGAVKKVPKETYDKTFSIPITDLSIDDWCLTFKLDRFDPAILLLERALGKVGKKYSIEDLIQIITSSQELTSKEKGFVTQTRRGVVSRLIAANRWGVLSSKGTPLKEIVVPGQITVIDTSFLDETVANLVIGVLARRILESRKVAVRMGKGAIPPPWLLIDEAHTAIPSKEKTPASDAIIEYVKQGRRPGCSIVLATQQPSAVDSKALSQLDILITHKLVFAADVDAVFKRMPTTVSKDMKNASFIRSLPLGRALVGDKEDFTPRAFVVKMRPRKSQHEGRSIPATESRLGEPEEIEDESIITDVQPSIKLGIDLNEAEAVVNKVRGRKFLIFGHEEKITKKKLVWWPMWYTEVSYPTLKFTGSLLFDAVTGEDFSGRTHGLLDIIDLKPIQRKILQIAQNEISQDDLMKEAGLDKTSLKRQVKQLLEKGYLKSWTEEKKVFYKSIKRVKLPDVEKLHSTVKIEKQTIADTIDPVLGREDILKSLEIWGSPKLKHIQLVYHPFWVFSLVNKGKRLVAVDAVTGDISTRVQDYHLLKNLF